MSELATNRANQELRHAITSIEHAINLGKLSLRGGGESLNSQLLAQLEEMLNLAKQPNTKTYRDLIEPYEAMGITDLYGALNSAILSDDRVTAQTVYIAAQQRRIDDGTTEIDCEWMQKLISEGREFLGIERAAHAAF